MARSEKTLLFVLSHQWQAARHHVTAIATAATIDGNERTTADILLWRGAAPDVVGLGVGDAVAALVVAAAIVVLAPTLICPPPIQ